MIPIDPRKHPDAVVPFVLAIQFVLPVVLAVIGSAALLVQTLMA